VLLPGSALIASLVGAEFCCEWNARMRLRTLCLLISMFLLSGSLRACPFCLAPPQSFSGQLQLCDFAVIAELLTVQAGTATVTPVSRLRIRHRLTASSALTTACHIDSGRLTSLPFALEGTAGQLYVLFGVHGGSAATGLVQTFARPDDSASPTPAAPPPGSWATSPFRTKLVSQKLTLRIADQCEWTDYLSVSSEVAQYLQNLPSGDLPRKDRLAWFAAFLENPDPAIAADAWAEFASASWDEVRSTAPLLQREAVRSWIADPLISPERLGLYGLLLGLCGQPADATFLVQQLNDPETGAFRFGGEGLLAGYLLLTGEDGLKRITPWFMSKSADDTARHALMQCLDFVQADEPQLTSSETRCSVMRQLAGNSVLQPTAVMTLARWQDWDSLSTVEMLFRREFAQGANPSGSEYLGVSGLQALLEFTRLCAAAGSEHSAAAAEFLIQAEAMLESKQP
jgi:hypothetical protein